MSILQQEKNVYTLIPVLTHANRDREPNRQHCVNKMHLPKWYTKRDYQYSFKAMQTPWPLKPHQLESQDWMTLSRLRMLHEKFWSLLSHLQCSYAQRQIIHPWAHTWIFVETLLPGWNAQHAPQSYTAHSVISELWYDQVHSDPSKPLFQPPSLLWVGTALSKHIPELRNAGSK